MKTCYKFQVLRSRRFFAFVALVGLGLLFTTSGAKAGGGCAASYKAGATAIKRTKISTGVLPS